MVFSLRVPASTSFPSTLIPQDLRAAGHSGEPLWMQQKALSREIQAPWCSSDDKKEEVIGVKEIQIHPVEPA